MINLFIRQPFTEAGEIEKKVTQQVLDSISSIKDDFVEPLSFLTGLEAHTKESFKTDFTKKTGLPFTPQAFRKHRLMLLDKAHAFINIRTALSESSTFELSYNIFRGPNVPIFFAIWNQSPMKTTLLQDLGDLCDIEYHYFDHGEELIISLKRFIERIAADVTMLYRVNS